MMAGGTGQPQNSARTMAAIPSELGRQRGPPSHRGDIRWQRGPLMRKATRSRMKRCGIPADTSGTGSSGRKSWLEMRAEGRRKMKNRLPAILVGIGLAAMTASVVYAELKKGAYRPAELGSMQQAAPTELTTDSNYEVSAYPVPALELAPGDGRQEVQIYCSTCHGPRYI